MTETEPHLATTHPQYPDGFPARVDDGLLGHWRTPRGVVVVENHPHGYEVHFGPCYDLEGCDACAPDRGPSNPHTADGHHFRLCPKHGAIVTVAGGEVGEAAVLEYLALEGSPPHVAELERRRELAGEAERARLERERLETEQALAEQESHRPTVAERLAAAEAELTALRVELEAAAGTDSDV